MELLVVIVILGVLSSAVVFAVRAITDRGGTNSCATDRRVIEQAEDTMYALNGGYGTELQLYEQGMIHGESPLHDVTVVADSYTLTPVGICA